MWLRKKWVVIGLISLFLFSVILVVFDHIDYLPSRLKNIFIYPLLFGVSFKNLSYIGIIWKGCVMGAGAILAIFLFSRMIFRKIYARIG